MVDIIHRVGIKAPLSKVYAALSTVEGVASSFDQSAFFATGSQLHGDSGTLTDRRGRSEQPQRGDGIFEY